MTRLLGRRGEQGAAAVEFALVAPLLLVLLFGIISYGYMLSFRSAMSQGVAEGARSAAIAPPATTDADRTIRAKVSVDEALGSYGVTCATSGVTCTVTFATCVGSTSRCATVTLSYPYRSGAVGPKFPGMGVVLPEVLEYRTSVEVST